MKIGILGAGQLAKMLAQSANRLSLETLCYAASQDQSASKVSTIFIGEDNDRERLTEFAQSVDVITFENEFVDIETALYLNTITSVLPNPEALKVTQDRLFEKTLFSEQHIPVPDYYPIDSEQALREALVKTGFPGVLKTRRLGYDGKGQAVIRDEASIASAWEALGKAPLILEAFVPFDTEVSLISVRSKAGECRFYPLVQNTHREGILRVSQIPFEHEALQSQAEQYVRALMEKFDYVGVMAVEFFVKGDQLYANEIAPRVHNSGHWTIEGARCSQFENHLRAVCGLPLGSAEIYHPCCMVNIIGEFPDRQTLLAIPGAHLHDYGKSARPGRKLGHVTILQTKAVPEALST
ncbi:MAG: 5-(carboxyamino)imidazole ribonucleotide synthase [Gammaproteobacteria bacterium]